MDVSMFLVRFFLIQCLSRVVETLVVVSYFFWVYSKALSGELESLLQSF